MSDETLSPRDQRLAELLALGEDDPRRRELLQDPELRAAHDAYVAFLKAEEPPGADLADAERRIGAALDAEIFGSASAESTSRLRDPQARDRMVRDPKAREAMPRGAFDHPTATDAPSVFDRLVGWLSAPAMRPALGLAVVAIIVGVIYVGRGGDGAGGPIDSFDIVATEDVTLRGGGAVPGSLGTVVADGTLVTLRWPGASAGSYTIVLLTPAYEEITRLGPFTTPSAEIDTSTLPAGALDHAAIFWRVIDGEAGAPRDGVGAIRLR